jgi:hypothetical protein
MSNHYTRFIITGDARTGSNMLAGALNTHHRIRCFREVFHHWQDRIDYHVEGYDEHDPAELAMRNSDPVRFLRERVFCEQPSQFEAVGFKYLYGHMWGFDALTQHLTADTELRVLHLRRRNMLRWVASVEIAEMTGRWLEWGAVETTPLSVRAARALRHPSRVVQRIRRRAPLQAKPAVSITREELRSKIEDRQRETRRTEQLFARHAALDVWYEDMLADRDREFERIQRFLGVDPAPLTVSLRRQNPEPLRELIANYDDLRLAFAGTEYAAFFDE